MQKVFLLKGAPASLKTTWAREKIKEDPTHYIRTNNDEIRATLNNSVFDGETEKLVSAIRLFTIREGLKKGRSVIVDNVNANKRHWEDCVSICKSANCDVMLVEKCFYEELDVLLERNAKREGIARVSDEVVKKFWNSLGGKQFKNYNAKTEIFKKRDRAVDIGFTPRIQNETKPSALICDLDGTFALIGYRSPYDASTCDIVDRPNLPVVETVNFYYSMGLGYKIIFCSGREDKDEAPTRRFIEKHFMGSQYELFMRKTGDHRGDDIVNEEIFNEKIKNNYYILFCLDDRNKVVNKYREMGLTVFQVAPGDF